MREFHPFQNGIHSQRVRRALNALHLVAITTIVYTVTTASAMAASRLVPSRFVETQRSGNLRDLAHIELHGEITKDDIRGVADLLGRYRLLYQSHDSADSVSRMYRTPYVFLNSQGGDVLAAMQIGQLLRGSLAHVIVDVGRECSSACLFLLAAGVRRDVFQDAKLGLHRPRFEEEMFASLTPNDATILYASLVERCRSYFQDMGISDRLMEDMLLVESRKIAYRDREYAEEVRLAGVDAGFQEWSRAKDLKELGEPTVRAREDLLDCYNSGTRLDLCDERFEAQMKRIRAKE